MGAAGFWWAASRVSLVMKKNDETHLDEKRKAAIFAEMQYYGLTGQVRAITGFVKNSGKTKGI